MHEEIKDIPLTDNKTDHAFEMDIDGDIAFIGYMEEGNTIILTHTEVPETLEGKGIGSVLVTKTLNHIESEGKKIVPQCPFVASYIKRHPEWERIVEQ
jgi:predicted GNAT family acetyltransferase